MSVWVTAACCATFELSFWSNKCAVQKYLARSIRCPWSNEIIWPCLSSPYCDLSMLRATSEQQEIAGFIWQYLSFFSFPQFFLPLKAICQYIYTFYVHCSFSFLRFGDSSELHLCPSPEMLIAGWTVEQTFFVFVSHFYDRLLGFFLSIIENRPFLFFVACLSKWIAVTELKQEEL